MKYGLNITVVLLVVLSSSVSQGQDEEAALPADQPPNAGVTEGSDGDESAAPVSKAAFDGEESSGPWRWNLGVVAACLLLVIIGRLANLEFADSASAANDIPASVSEDTSDGVAEPAVSAEVSGGETDEVDHEFVLAIALETTRLEDRLQKLGDDQKPKKAMQRIVRRLDGNLLEINYERGSLLGMPYRDGMNCSPEFVPSDDPAHAEPVITRVLQPQVFYLGKLIQVPKIQVSENFDSTKNE